MKKIFFIRHAKSSWADHSLQDIDRPLNKRGNRDAPFMAEKLSAIIPHVDLILCSPARRAQETMTYFTSSIHAKENITNQRIYHAPASTLIDVMHDIEPNIGTALIFGHNPGFTMVYNYFCEEGLDNLPTCGVFEIQVNGEWADADTTNSSIGHLLYPKMYLA